MSRAWQRRIDGEATWGVVTTAGVAILSVLLTVTLAGLPASAQKAAPSAVKKDAAPASKADGASAQRDVEAGIKSLQEGKFDASVQHLSSALTTGKLPSTQMARALYYRGLAYQRQGKPAQAIADFTSALWLKNGLDANQRADALQNRAAAYRDAGLSDQADGDEKKATSVAAAQTSATRSSSSAASADTSSSASSSSGGIGGFFGNLFGGSSSQGEQTADAPAAKAPAPRVAVDWSERTEVRRVEKTAAAAPPAVTGSTPPERPAKPVQKASAGGIHLQVATVRSLGEARNIAARLKQMGVSDTRGVTTSIDETTVGNMGTLYQVRIGPFANNDEPRVACVKIRSSGLDCLITPQ